jgi:hypothetical protein
VVAQHEAVDRGSAMARKTRLGEVREAVKGPAERWPQTMAELGPPEKRRKMSGANLTMGLASKLGR